MNFFLNLVMEYVPETIFRVIKHYSSMKQRIPLIYVKLYTYQIFRGLAYIHTAPGIYHRHVKPQNLLIDRLIHQVKLCDFGSAKVLKPALLNLLWRRVLGLNVRPKLMVASTIKGRHYGTRSDNNRMTSNKTLRNFNYLTISKKYNITYCLIFFLHMLFLNLICFFFFYE
ncbi:hypothetical protein AAZX31_01G081100 [Glycine max]